MERSDFKLAALASVTQRSVGESPTSVPTSCTPYLRALRDKPFPAISHRRSHLLQNHTVTEKGGGGGSGTATLACPDDGRGCVLAFSPFKENPHASARRSHTLHPNHRRRPPLSHAARQLPCHPLRHSPRSPAAPPAFTARTPCPRRLGRRLRYALRHLRQSRPRQSHRPAHRQPH